MACYGIVEFSKLEIFEINSQNMSNLSFQFYRNSQNQFSILLRYAISEIIKIQLIWVYHFLNQSKIDFCNLVENLMQGTKTVKLK